MRCRTCQLVCVRLLLFDTHCNVFHDTSDRDTVVATIMSTPTMLPFLVRLHWLFCWFFRPFRMKLSCSMVRHLLRTCHCPTCATLLRKFQACEPSVTMLVHLLAQVRLAVVHPRQYLGFLRRVGEVKPRWFIRFCKQLYMLWCVLQRSAWPVHKSQRHPYG